MGAGEWLKGRLSIIPPLFNIYHQAVMRVAVEERLEEARRRTEEAGVGIHWVPGSAFPSSTTWEKHNSEAIKVQLLLSLFADDTTLVGKGEELERGVEKTKQVMSWFEERNNDDKEEKLVFASEESGKVRMLGVTAF